MSSSPAGDTAQPSLPFLGPVRRLTLTCQDETKRHLVRRSRCPWADKHSSEAAKEALKRVEEALREQIMDGLLRGTEPNRLPGFMAPNTSQWENVTVDQDVGLVPVPEPQLSLVHFYKKASSRRYSHLLLVLAKMWRLLRAEVESFSSEEKKKKISLVTRRELYYQNVADFVNQADVDWAVGTISGMLKIPRYYLRVVATSKGLVSGHLRFRTSPDGPVIDCKASKGGELVPQHMDSLSEIRSEAEFILVVEKDATFQRLIEDGFASDENAKCVVLTGKGMPDLNTRHLIYKLWTLLSIPVFALVDSDPFGIEILCTYRFGSLAMAFGGERAAVPAIRWIGIHPSEYEYLDPDQLLPLTTADTNKITALQSRPYLPICPGLSTELRLMEESGVKAEIQNLASSPGEYVREKMTKALWV